MGLQGSSSATMLWGFRVWGLGFGVWGLGSRVSGLRFGVWGLGFGGAFADRDLTSSRDKDMGSEPSSCL